MKNASAEQKVNISHFLSTMVDTLNKAVGSHLMKREHAASIWKQLLKDNDVDVSKEGKGVIKKNGTIKKS